jgi:hypothetical protein
MRINPSAPPAYNGLSGAGSGYVDQDFSYVYTVTLTANQMLRDQVLAIATDADFCWRALVLGAYTGAFSFRFSDSQGYYLSNGMLVYSNLLWGTTPIPYPMLPEIVLPAGGRIGIDIQDLSGGSNSVELTFRGAKRYRIQG